MMFLQEEMMGLVCAVLRRHTAREEMLRVVKSVSGGSINQCYQLRYGEALFFLKLNSSSRYPGMLKAEAGGLKKIADTGAIKVPQIIAVFETAQEQVLLLEWVEDGPNSSASQESLGRSLANLHRHEHDYFGLEHDNYIGSLSQSNKISRTWSDFFINQRLKPQVSLGIESGLLTQEISGRFESLYQKLDELSPPETPRLIHGDLWSGNYMIDDIGEPVLIDPAVYHANREVDIAMTTLFGGFSDSFYRAYNEVLPLQAGWEKRLDLWNLYPLLIHVNLFGLSYLSQVNSILKKYL